MKLLLLWKIIIVMIISVVTGYCVMKGLRHGILFYFDRRQTRRNLKITLYKDGKTPKR